MTQNRWYDELWDKFYWKVSIWGGITNFLCNTQDVYSKKVRKIQGKFGIRISNGQKIVILSKEFFKNGILIFCFLYIKWPNIQYVIFNFTVQNSGDNSSTGWYVFLPRRFRSQPMPFPLCSPTLLTKQDNWWIIPKGVILNNNFLCDLQTHSDKEKALCTFTISYSILYIIMLHTTWTVYAVMQQ